VEPPTEPVTLHGYRMTWLPKRHALEFALMVHRHLPQLGGIPKDFFEPPLLSWLAGHLALATNGDTPLTGPEMQAAYLAREPWVFELVRKAMENLLEAMVIAGHIYYDPETKIYSMPMQSAHELGLDDVVRLRRRRDGTWYLPKTTDPRDKSRRPTTDVPLP
jgi:hypothetical protein